MTGLIRKTIHAVNYFEIGSRGIYPPPSSNDTTVRVGGTSKLGVSSEEATEGVLSAGVNHEKRKLVCGATED